jgi:hypothetical protein
MCGSLLVASRCRSPAVFRAAVCGCSLATVKHTHAAWGCLGGTQVFTGGFVFVLLSTLCVFLFFSLSTLIFYFIFSHVRLILSN